MIYHTVSKDTEVSLHGEGELLSLLSMKFESKGILCLQR